MVVVLATDLERPSTIHSDVFFVICQECNDEPAAGPEHVQHWLAAAREAMPDAMMAMVVELVLVLVSAAEAIVGWWCLLAVDRPIGNMSGGVHRVL